MNINETKKLTVHHVLIHSYSIFFISLILGLLVDLLYPLRIIPKAVSLQLGIALLVLAPTLIFWAQYTSSNLRVKKEQVLHVDFKKGPYRFTRNPTHVGLGFLIIGFGVLINSISIIIFTLIAVIISSNVFLKKQEKMLEESYGEEYRKYKNTLKF